VVRVERSDEVFDVVNESARERASGVFEVLHLGEPFSELDFLEDQRVVPYIGFDSGELGIWEGGVRTKLGRLPMLGPVEVGLSWIINEDGDESTPPKDDSGGRGSRDEDAPLEEWSHPVENVLVKNDSGHYIRLSTRVRPHTTTWFQLSYAKLRGASLSGTALEPGPDGGLVRSDRSYRFSVVDGSMLEARLEVIISDVFPEWPRGWPELAALLSYRRFEEDLGVTQSSGSSVSLGLGTIVFGP
jgi:hypothetical protein